MKLNYFLMNSRRFFVYYFYKKHSKSLKSKVEANFCKVTLKQVMELVL